MTKQYTYEKKYNFLKIYPKSSINNQCKILLKRIANNEYIISYEFLPYKIYFGQKDSNRFYAIDFLKKYSMLCVR